MLQADPGSDRRTEPGSEGMGQLFFDSDIRWRLTGRSTGTYGAVCCNISDGAASGPFDRRRRPPCISTSRLLGWRCWRQSGPRDCLRIPEAGAIRRAECGKSASPVRRGERGSPFCPRLLSYSTGSVYGCPELFNARGPRNWRWRSLPHRSCRAHRFSHPRADYSFDPSSSC